MNNPWLQSEISILLEKYPTTPTKELAVLLNRPVGSLHTKAKKLRLKKDPNYISTRWTPEKDQILINLYQTHTAKEIGSIIGFAYTSIKNRARKLGLGKKENKGCFVKGHVPANKGKKMPSDVYKKAKGTMFKKGHKPVNTQYDGAISIRKDKRTGLSYKYIRIAEGNWDLLHRVNYKKKNGDIPTSIFLRCIDGNRLNCDPDNWEPVDMKTNMDLNRLTQWPPELQEVIKLNNKLKKQING